MSPVTIGMDSIKYHTDVTVHRLQTEVNQGEMKFCLPFGDGPTDCFTSPGLKPTAFLSDHVKHYNLLVYLLRHTK